MRLRRGRGRSANPNVAYYNNDNSRQPGSQGLAAGQQEMSATERLRVQFEAATYLFEVTGKEQLKSFADANYAAILPPWGASMWEVDALEALLYYARLPGATPAVAKSIREHLLTNLWQASEVFQSSLQRVDPYRAPMKDYTWGSNKGKAMQARLYQLAALYSTDRHLSEIASAAALEYAHYIHGVNPLGLVYLTNMAPAGACHSASTMFHAWFAYGTRWQQVTEQLPGPPPGFLVGGPIRNSRLMRAAAHLLGRPHTAATGQRRSRCASGILCRRWRSRRPSRIFNSMTHGRRILGGLGAFAGLPIILCPAACCLYPLTRHSTLSSPNVSKAVCTKTKFSHNYQDIRAMHRHPPDKAASLSHRSLNL